jgi:hypothetical protein
MGGVMWVYDAAESYIAKEFLNDMGRTSKCLKKKAGIKSIYNTQSHICGNLYMAIYVYLH